MLYWLRNVPLGDATEKNTTSATRIRKVHELLAARSRRASGVPVGSWVGCAGAGAVFVGVLIRLCLPSACARGPRSARGTRSCPACLPHALAALAPLSALAHAASPPSAPVIQPTSSP